jgi:hypothetical protein
MFGARGSWKGSGDVTFAYQWYRCDTMGAGCKPLRGVTRKSRLVGPGDVGRTHSFAVRATDSKGTTTAYASLVGPIAGTPTALALKARPVVSGDSVLGATVRVNPGRWQPKPSAFSFQWARCNVHGRACIPISGATDDTHEVATADLGHPLVAIVQAKASTQSRAVFSFATPAAVAKRTTPKPRVTKPPKTTPPPITPPQTTPAPTTPPQTTPAPTTPAPTTPPPTGPPPTTVPPGPGPTSKGPPIVANIVQQRKKLSASTGSWAGSGAVGYAYQWYRCDAAGAHCKSIHGSTAVTYTPVGKDVGQTLGLAVRASDSTGTSTAYASLVGPVPAADATLASAAQPTITGEPSQGQLLQVSTGSWTQPPTAYSYQWQRCNPNGRLCAPIPGATSSSYMPAPEDLGLAVLAVVHATVGAAAQDALSVATRPIAPAGPTLVEPPTVVGTAKQGARLTGSTGTWTGSGAIAYAFQWYRCDAKGAHCKSIHGATKSTYVQVAKDVRKTIGFAVRATDAVGTTTAYPGLVGPVPAVWAPLVATAQPSIVGTPQQGQTLQVTGGSWTPAPTAAAYQWQRCNPNGRLCAPIPGATASMYTVTAEDAGHAVLALVKATGNGVQQAALSTPTARIA